MYKCWPCKKKGFRGELDTYSISEKSLIETDGKTIYGEWIVPAFHCCIIDNTHIIICPSEKQMLGDCQQDNERYEAGTEECL